ncbi:MAG: PAC2 family protein, partial [Actinobacteria bacterium]|nr:PAC2 family protein [Actinomycetota bacterium]
AITHLLTIWSHQQIAVVDSEEYYDFQVNRPQIKIDQSNIREIIWPGTIVYAVSSPALTNDFLIVRGVEPSMRWKSFISDLLDLADDYEVSMIISIGALLADTPHSRPFNVAISGAHPEVSERWPIDLKIVVFLAIDNSDLLMRPNGQKMGYGRCCRLSSIIPAFKSSDKNGAS